MESNYKIKYSFIILIVCIIIPSVKAIDFSYPRDLPTLELLIELHKRMKKAEQQSNEQLMAITGEHVLSTDKAKTISDIKTTIDKKLYDVNSYFVLAAAISNTTLRLLDLTESYSDFITETGPIVAKKPYTSYYYGQVQKKLYDTTVKLTKNLGTFSLANMISLRASMDERLKLLYFIDTALIEMQYLIQKANNYIRYTNQESVIIKSVNDMFDKNFNNELVESLKTKWNTTKFQ